LVRVCLSLVNVMCCQVEASALCLSMTAKPTYWEGPGPLRAVTPLKMHIYASSEDIPKNSSYSVSYFRVLIIQIIIYYINQQSTIHPWKIPNGLYFTMLLYTVIILQSGREVTVHRPIRYHNLIWITYVRLGYMSSESVCASWCCTHKSDAPPFPLWHTAQIFVVVVATRSHSTLDNTPQRIVCCGKARTTWWPWPWVWGADCLGVRWLLAHSVRYTIL
jgi:hypothetical protein